MDDKNTFKKYKLINKNNLNTELLVEASIDIYLDDIKKSINSHETYITYINALEIIKKIKAPI